jgi:hypothetical protein
MASLEASVGDGTRAATGGESEVGSRKWGGRRGIGGGRGGGRAGGTCLTQVADSHPPP